MFTTRFEAWVRRHAERMMTALASLPVTPNQITVVGTLIAFLAAVLAGSGQLLVAGIGLAVGGTFDILDGPLAGAARRTDPSVAILHPALDRHSDGALYLGRAAYCPSRLG